MDENLFLFFRNHNIWYKKARYWKKAYLPQNGDVTCKMKIEW